MRHNGFALVDIISPCVSFNDHDSSTKSYRYTRDHYTELAPVDFVPLRREITADTSATTASGGAVSVTMHDGSVVRFRRVASDYDPREPRCGVRARARAQARGEVVTGLLYIDESRRRTCTPSPRRRPRRSSTCRSTTCVRGARSSAELMEEYR